MKTKGVKKAYLIFVLFTLLLLIFGCKKDSHTLELKARLDGDRIQGKAESVILTTKEKIYFFNDNRIIEMTGKYPWTIENKNIELLENTDVGKIFSFPVIFLREIRENAKINEDGSFEIKLSPWNQMIVVKSANQKEVIINVTEHMDWLTESLKENKSCIVIARLKELEPLAFELLGVSVK